MEETCPLFDALPLSSRSRKVRGNFFYSPGEKSTVLTVTTLLAYNVFDVGGTVAVPQKCRLTQIGKSICAFLCGQTYCLLKTWLAEANFSTGMEQELMFMYVYVPWAIEHLLLS